MFLFFIICSPIYSCLLYTSDAADERSRVALGGRRILKKKKTTQYHDERTEAKSKRQIGKMQISKLANRQDLSRIGGKAN